MRYLIVGLLFAGLGRAEDLETPVLGGPCLVESFNNVANIQAWHALVQKQMAAAARKDVNAAIELTRQVLRSRCSLSIWWFKLAELQHGASRPADALQTLSAMYPRRGNDLQEYLANPKSALHAFAGTEMFRKSALGQKLIGNERALAQRVLEGQRQASASAKPPADYVAKGACPFECCRYGQWTVRRPVTLYSEPDGKPVELLLKTGQRVTAMTGEVRLKPIPVRTFFPTQGEILYLLDYTGEGFGNVWRQGKVENRSVTGARRMCSFPEAECWGEFLTPVPSEKLSFGVWWVKIQTVDGMIAWVQGADGFSGADACG